MRPLKGSLRIRRCLAGTHWLIRQYPWTLPCSQHLCQVTVTLHETMRRRVKQAFYCSTPIGHTRLSFAAIHPTARSPGRKSPRGTKDNLVTFSGCRKPTRSNARNQHARSYTVNAKIVGLAGALVTFLASPAGAQTLTVENAHAIVTPFYEALNRPAGKDVVKLIEQPLPRTG